MKLPPITPGRWVANIDELDTTEVFSPAYPGRPIGRATSYWQGEGPRAAERQANGVAMAAVPDMLQALVEAKLQLEYMDERSPSGTTPAVIARLEQALRAAGATDD